MTSWHSKNVHRIKLQTDWRPASMYREAFPILFNVSQSEKAQFFSGCIIGEMPPIFNDFTQLHMQAFNRIGRVNHFPNFRRISRKESPAPIAAATSG